MKITITESRTAGEYTAAQGVEIDTSDRKLFQGVASPEAHEFFRRSGSKKREDAETEVSGD